jgi:hypothetical protein
VLVALWFTVLKPAVKSAAREAAVEQNHEIIQAVQQASGTAGEAKKKAEAANASRRPQPRRPRRRPRRQPTQTGHSRGCRRPTDFRIAADSPIQGDVKKFDEVPSTLPDAKKTLVITDLVLQNPRGDAGTLRLLRRERQEEHPAGSRPRQLPGPRPPLAPGMAIPAGGEGSARSQVPEPGRPRPLHAVGVLLRQDRRLRVSPDTPLADREGDGLSSSSAVSLGATDPVAENQTVHSEQGSGIRRR